jgi:hypothetical protein
MAKKVLLARPHAFIVAEMRPFLERTGYQPGKLESLDEMDQGKLGSFSGAIISTAVVSSIPAKPAEVFTALRQHYPSLPVIFAGLTEFGSTLATIQRIVHGLHPGAAILPFNAGTENHPHLGERDVFLFLIKEDISGSAAESILRRHFR